jgi:AcrR family transcriptional regulator
MSPRIGADLHTIVKAAADIADTRGIEAVTLASVAQALNIRSPSLYNHVDGLPGLRRKLAAYGLQLLYDRLAAALCSVSGAEAVRSLAAAYVEFARSNPGLYEATLRAPDREEPELERLGAAIVDLALEALSPYGLEESAALHAVRGIRSIIQGFSSLERVGGFGLPLDLDLSLRLLIDAFLEGLSVYRRG